MAFTITIEPTGAEVRDVPVPTPNGVVQARVLLFHDEKTGVDVVVGPLSEEMQAMLNRGTSKIQMPPGAGSIAAVNGEPAPAAAEGEGSG